MHVPQGGFQSNGDGGALWSDVANQREFAPVLAALENRARALARHRASVKRFKRHSALLDEAVGADFVRKGPGKRYVHREAALPFIAERFLSSYLLIIAFRDVGAVDAQGVVLALERARSVISDMLGTCRRTTAAIARSRIPSAPPDLAPTAGRESAGREPIC